MITHLGSPKPLKIVWRLNWSTIYKVQGTQILAPSNRRATKSLKNQILAPSGLNLEPTWRNLARNWTPKTRQVGPTWPQVGSKLQPKFGKWGANTNSKNSWKKEGSRERCRGLLKKPQLSNNLGGLKSTAGAPPPKPPCFL